VFQKIGAALVQGIKPLVISAVPSLKATSGTIQDEKKDDKRDQAKGHPSLRIVSTQEENSAESGPSPASLPVPVQEPVTSTKLAQAYQIALQLFKLARLPLWPLRAKAAYQASSQQKTARFRPGTLIDREVK
jgi:hypothetical protein